MDFSSNSVPFSMGGFMGADATMESIFNSCCEQLARFYSVRQAAAGAAGKTYLPAMVPGEVAKTLSTDANKIYAMAKTWRGLIDSAKTELQKQADTMLQVPKMNPNDPQGVDDMKRIRDHYLALSSDAKFQWIRECVDRADKASLAAVLSLPVSVAAIPQHQRRWAKRAMNPSAYEEIMARATAIACAAQAVDRLLGYVAGESMSSPPAAASGQPSDMDPVLALIQDSGD